jgi:hypothetical protein
MGKLTTPLGAPYALLDARQSAALRRRFHVEPGQFLVILLGEDGKQKLRSAKPVPVEILNALVDSSMPCRQEEEHQRRRDENASWHATGRNFRLSNVCWTDLSLVKTLIPVH